MSTKLSAEHLQRAAFVYVRQSTISQSAIIAKVSNSNMIWVSGHGSWVSPAWW